jgi:hypothetical protein
LARRTIIAASRRKGILASMSDNELWSHDFARKRRQENGVDRMARPTESSRFSLEQAICHPSSIDFQNPRAAARSFRWTKSVMRC